MFQASDVAKSLPSTESVLHSLGLQRARSGGDMLSGVAVFGAGLLVGAGLALLFAPGSGAEMREQIGAKVEDAKEKIGRMTTSGSGDDQATVATASGIGT